MDHSPLTQRQKDILNQIAAAPLEISTGDQIAQNLQDLGFLGQAGYLNTVQTYADPDLNQARYRWTRTDKPIP
jgi:hypothetical protein